ncbi:MAG: FtsQ-type POTRA domain-containing protein [Tissierellia bacterium]|nr:FtsQ-type POTRA domain-containing protein [Tissierellia bacterium]
MSEKPTRVQLKRQRRRRFLRFLLFLALLISSLVFMLKSEIFNIDNYSVLGNKNLSKEIIINTSEINQGENIFKIKKSIAEENILALAYVKNVQIKRKLPRTIVFNIEERVGVLQTRSGSTMFLVDIEGYVLEELEEADSGLPNIIGFDLSSISIGDNIFSGNDHSDIINFIIESKESKLLGNSSKIDMTLLEDINIELNNGISVAFGTLDNVKYKLRLLNEILKDIELKQIQCKMIIMNKGDNPILVIDDKSEG